MGIFVNLNVILTWGDRIEGYITSGLVKIAQMCPESLCFPGISAFSKKIGFLAARFGAMIFTRALGYAKRPLLPGPDIAGSWPRHICTVNTIHFPCR